MALWQPITTAEFRQQTVALLPSLPPILPPASLPHTLTSIRCNLELDVGASPLLIGSYIRCDFKILRCCSALPHFNFPLSQGSLMLEGCQLVVNLPPGELVTAWECDHYQSWCKNKTKEEIIRINVPFCAWICNNFSNYVGYLPCCVSLLLQTCLSF